MTIAYADDEHRNRVRTKTHAKGVHQAWKEDFDGYVRVLWIVPELPPSMNAWEKMHWSRRNRIKDSWTEFAWLYQRTSGLPMNAAWVYAQAEIVFRKNAHRDLSNYDATLWKILPDVLQRVGILKDDTEQFMRRGPVRFKVDKTLGGHLRDRLQPGCTKIAMIAKRRDDV